MNNQERKVHTTSRRRARLSAVCLAALALSGGGALTSPAGAATSPAGAATSPAGAATSPAGAAAFDPFVVGYVWADRPSAASYTPHPHYSYNSRGGTNTITRSGTGAYRLRLPHLASSGGNVQVTAYGPAPANCKVGAWWPSGRDQMVQVLCYTPSGSRTDARFSASFTRGGGAGGTIGFAWANQPSATSYTPSATYQYNNRGGAITIRRLGVGTYDVRIPNTTGARAAGSVKVTAYGSSSGHCKVGFWGPDSGAQRVRVNCYTSGGAPSDELFSMVYVDNQNILGDDLLAEAYAWGNLPSSAAYVPSANYQRSATNSRVGTVTIRRAGVGQYDVFFPWQHEGLDGGNVQATAYGAGPARCQVGHWVGAPNGRTARINCFTNGGAPLDTFFTTQYTARLQ